MSRRLLSLVISIFSFHICIGQNNPDSAFVSSAINHAKKIYNERLGTHTHLHNGVEHKHYREEIEAEAYLEPDWTDGSIFYGGELFDNVPLMYDMIAQRAVTYFYGQPAIDLITDKVDWFVINGRKFVRVETDPAFYELLEDGEVKLYARRRKKIDEKVGERNVTYSVSGTTHYFLYKDGKYISVKGKSSVLKSLELKKKDVKQFRNDDKEITMKQYVAHYNLLNK